MLTKEQKLIKAGKQKERRQTLKVLTYARNLIEEEGSWTQNYFAKNSYGVSVPLDNASACKFCAAGAIRKASNDLGIPYPFALRSLEKILGGHLYKINDLRSTKQIHILMAFDLAILGAGRGLN